MVFKQSIQRELARTFSATLVVLVTIVMTMMLIRTLGLAAKGVINPQEVMLIMSYSVLGHTPTILALSLFITVVSTISRMIRDSEIIIWISSGSSVLGFLRPLLRFAAPIFITIAVMVFMIWPWANSQMQHLRERFEQRGDIERILPGEFQESSNGKRVIYVDKSDTQNPNDIYVKNVLITYFDKGKEVITSAQSGRTHMIQGDKFIVLGKGQQAVFDQTTDSIKLTEFETMGSRARNEQMTASAGAPNTRATLTLIQEPQSDNLGELSWRLGIVLASANLLLLALATCNMKPRQSKGTPLLLAMLIFVSYYNFINIGQNWINSDRMGFFMTIFLIHGSVFAFAVTWLMRRHLRP